MRPLIHLALLMLVVWLPVAQAGSLCCVRDPAPLTATTPAHAASMTMPCHDTDDAQTTATPDSCDGGCAQLCHLGVVVAPVITAMAEPPVVEVFATLQAATHIAHTRPLLRPPAPIAAA